MKHYIDGWLVESYNGTTGRIVTHATTKATGRPAVEDSGFKLPGRRGKVPVRAHLPGEQLYTLAVDYVAADYVAARALAAALHAKLPAGDGTVALRREDTGLDVFANAQVLAATDLDGLNVGNSVLSGKIVFTLPGGVWFDSTEQTITVATGTTTITALTGGSAAMEPVWVVTGNGATTSVEITDVASGAWWRLTGDITAGQQVTVDPLAHTATAGGVTDFSAMLTVGDRPFYLSVGAQVVQARNGPQVTQVKARRAWYE